MNNLLHRSLAQAEAGLIIEKTVEVDLKPLVVKAAELVISFYIQFIYETLSTVRGDPEKLAQVFQNLFGNGVVHGKAQITVWTKPVAEAIKPFINSDGAFIPPEYRWLIFKQAFTTKKGAGGLGLAIVQKLAEAHGWRITLEMGSEIDTTFCIFIPALVPYPSDVA